MKTSTIKFLLLAVALVSLTACDNNAYPDPDEELEAYLKATYTGQNEEAYDHISSVDRSLKGLKDFTAENKKRANPFAKLFVDNYKVKVLSLNKSETNATLKISITQPDLDSMVKDVLKSTPDPALIDNRETGRLLVAKYGDEDAPTTFSHKTYQLVKEQGSWKIHLDWQTEILEQAKEEQIAALLEEARQLRKSSSTLDTAILKYEEALVLDSSIEVAKQGIGDTKRAIREYELKQEYIKNVSLYDLEAKFYTLFSEMRVPGVKFKLKNNGERLLREVEVTVYFEDADGTIIAEDRYHPVLAIKKSYRGDQTILKHNYIWQMEEGNFYKAEAVPTAWAEGKVSARITDIKFAE